MAIIWGEPIWGDHGCGIRLGYEVSSVPNNNKTEVVTTMKVYFQTWYNVSIENNKFVINFCGNKVYNGACSIQTSYSHSGWNDANIRQIWSGTTKNGTWSLNATFTTAYVFKSQTAKISGSGTAWTQCGSPTISEVTYDESNNKFIVKGKCGTNGINNPVGGVELYWKWNSTSVAWDNCSDKKINNGIGSQGSYSFEITEKDIPNTANSVAFIVYTVDKITTDPNSAIVYREFNQILATFVHLPHRYYFSSGTKNGFKEKNDEVYNQDEDYRHATDENYVSWTYTTPNDYKNYKRYINIYIVEPGTNTWHIMNDGNYIEIDSNNKILDLNNNIKAHIAALQCMQSSNCGYWNNNTTIPWARYLDCEWILQNFIEANDTTKKLKQNNNYYYPEGKDGKPYYYIGFTSFKTVLDEDRNGRIELTTPPRSTNCIPNAIYQRNENEDWGYESNKFDISWKPSMFANQYLLKYYVGVPNSSDNKSINSVLLDEGWKYGYSKTDGLNHYTLSIPSLLAGQRVWFSITPRWHGEVVEEVEESESQTYSYTYTAAETATTGIQKQGGIIAVDENTGKYQNYHIYVADKNGKPVKAKAVYVYTDKMSDNGKTFEWKLCKTI